MNSIADLSTSITFSAVTSDDFDELVALRIAAMRESLERVGRFDPERARERLRKAFYPEHTQFIVLDGQRVGFYTFRPTEGGYQLDHLYVHPDCQSRGVGSHVIRQLLAQADERQMPVHLGALRDSPSNRFYQRHGFVKTTEDEWDIYYLRAAKAHEPAEVRSNRELWDNLAKVHVDSAFYDVPGFLKGRSSLNEIDLSLLWDVRGKSVLHLQCHFGMDTLSLARLGAVVTGVDFSEVAINQARDLNDRLGLAAQFIQCDVNRLDELLDAEFDIVFASFGVIGWHSDLTRWARIVSRFLKPEGKFCLAEFHPARWMLSDDHSRVAYSYFKSDAIIEANEKSYANPDGPGMGTSYCWNHSLGEVFQALESHGLTIRDFKEYDYSPYRCFQDATEKDGRYYVKGLEHMLPMVYSLTAFKSDRLDEGT